MFKKNILPTFLLMAGSLLAGKELYVDVNASAGGDGSTAKPYRTIQQAADAVNPGDTVIIRPGVYFETVRLTRFGLPGKPVTFRADKIVRRRVVITGADRKIRQKELKWTLCDKERGIYSIPYNAKEPGRVLYDEVDLYPYSSLEAMKKLESTPGIPGPRHGFVQEKGKLYVRLRADGKHGSTDPNLHLMAVGPSSRIKMTAPNTPAYNFGLLGKKDQELYVVLDGLTFETPGIAAVGVSGSHAVIRNALFLGCWQGGVKGLRPMESSDVVVEYCEYHSFPIFHDAQELTIEAKNGKRYIDPKKTRLHWWVHKHRKLNGVVTAYEHGIASTLGKDWTIRHCWIHDAFEGVANSDGNHTIFEENRCERLIDNAFEFENHGINCHVRRNLFCDVMESVSMQPLHGHPWPGPNYVYCNVFCRTADCPPWPFSAFKIGIQQRQWGKYPGLTGDSWKHVTIPGLLIFNNTIIEPYKVVFNNLVAQQRIDNVRFCNNLVVSQRLGGLPAACFSFSGNRMAILKQSLKKFPPSVQTQLFPAEEVLPKWKENHFLPEKFHPAMPIPDAPVQLKYVGALQSPDDRVAAVTGVQEEK